MASKLTTIFILLLTMHIPCCLCVDSDEWIDPYDMENFDPSSNSMKGKDGNKQVPNEPPLNKAQPAEEKKPPEETPDEVDEKVNPSDKGGNRFVCPQDSSPCPSLFRQYVNTLLYHIKGKVYSGAEEVNLRVRITETDIDYLEKYSDSSGSDNNVRHVHEILSSMIQLASEVHQSDPSVNRLWLESLFGIQLEKILMIVALAGILVLIFAAANTFHFSWRKLTVKLVFFLFVISVFWQWYELYKKEEAKQHMTIMKEMPEGCRKREKDESFMKTVFFSFASTFTFEKDECLQHYEHMLIDPFWRVTPTQALAKTLIRFFVSPAREVGEAVQELLTGLLKGLPAQLWPVALGFMGVFCFLLLFMYFGYRVSLPLGLIAVEPGQRADNSKVLEQITEQKEQLRILQEDQRRQMKEVQESLRTDRAALMEQLHMQQQILSLPSIKSQLVKHVQDNVQKAVSSSASTKSPSMITYGHSEECTNGLTEDVTKRENDEKALADSVQDQKTVDEDSEDKCPGSSVKPSDQSDSFEEISVSNIEAIGQRDS